MADQPMSSQSATHSIIYLGLDVHKESVTVALLPAEARTPTRVDRLPNDLVKLKRWLERTSGQGEIRACYEASGAGYVIHRAMRERGMPPHAHGDPGERERRERKDDRAGNGPLRQAAPGSTPGCFSSAVTQSGRSGAVGADPIVRPLTPHQSPARWIHG